MVISFCGHSRYDKTEEDKIKILSFFNEVIGDSPADMYLGGYGNFDEFAYECCKEYKNTHSQISLFFITPYITAEYQKNHLSNLERKYDAIIYPEIEDKPLKFAITYRNMWMMEKADCVIAYIEHHWGGAYKTYSYAKKKGKFILNLGKSNNI